ncbi:MAG: NAD(P)-binding protein [Planctomycetota bacterium]|nr:NAD(P)-binding protein [Planctomycetota bacterium]
MADCARHPRIKILTCHEVVGLSGQAGEFRLKLVKKPRYVDEKKCTSCGDCAKVCPTETVNQFDVGLSRRKAVYKYFAQAVPAAWAIEKNGVARCVRACPAMVDARGYVSLIAEEKFAEALAVEKKKNPLPLVCGRVCTAPCMEECRRKEIEEAIDIRGLKRFIADYELKAKALPKPELPPKKEKKVAVVGSGPGGLTAAYQLALLGYDVTIFEALGVAGGMLTVGIPEYRLPRDILAAEIKYITELGVKIELDSPVGAPGRTLDDLRKQGYGAVLLAIGAHKSLKLDIPGEEAGGVVAATDFLRDVNTGGNAKAGKRVAVIGGGNAAIDCARTAWRLGAGEITIVYRRSRQEMPAEKSEIEEAEKEGVKLQLLAAPVEIIAGKGGQVAQLKCVKMELGAPDASGRPRPIPIKGSEYIMDVDMVIPAIGQKPETEKLGSLGEIATAKQGTITVDPVSAVTGREGVFACGDAVLGPATVVKAIAGAHQAAISIDRYLSGQDMKAGRMPLDLKPLAERKDPLPDVPPKPRMKATALPVAKRAGNFKEVELGFTREEAVEEAKRCLNCGPCCECRECERVCLAQAIIHDQKEEDVELEAASIVVATGSEIYDPLLATEYGFGRIKNVITSLHYERLISASGPTGGHLRRLSDGKPAHSIAYILCVGSRDVATNNYCSTVCCMYAAKDAMLAREHDPTSESYVFFTDTRCSGKGFWQYIEKSRQNYDVHFVRGRVSRVTEDRSHSPVLWYEDTKLRRVKRLKVDMVVLANAVVPAPGTKQLAKILGIELDKFGFLAADCFSPTDSTRPGVFIAGCVAGPRDIAESVAHASAAAARAAESVGSTAPASPAHAISTT